MFKHRSDKGEVRVIIHSPRGTPYVGSKPNSSSNWQSFPGGGIEEDETPELAGFRELLEETGVSDVQHLVHLITIPHPFLGHPVYFFAGESPGLHGLKTHGLDEERVSVASLEKLETNPRFKSWQIEAIRAAGRRQG